MQATQNFRTGNSGVTLTRVHHVDNSSDYLWFCGESLNAIMAGNFDITSTGVISNG